MTLPAPAPLASGGGGGGGLSAEADQAWMIDTGNSDTVFLRRFTRDENGNVTGTADTQADGTTVYAETGPSIPIESYLGGPNLVVTANRRIAGDSPVAVAAGAQKVIVLAVADDVDVNGAALPANVGVTFGADGFTTDALTVTIAGSGDALIIEERAA